MNASSTIINLYDDLFSVKNTGRLFMRLVDLFVSPNDLIAALDAHALLGNKAEEGDQNAMDELARYVSIDS